VITPSVQCSCANALSCNPRRVTLVGVPSPLIQSVETVTAVIGGCAALGSVLMCAREIRRDERQWDAAIGWGSVGGALVGAGILVIEIGANV
jgi:hypothetical protein